MTAFFEHTQLLNGLSIKRAAYSDRMCWLMAELSGLVYDSLPCEQVDQARVDKIYAAMENGEERTVINELILESIQQHTGSGSAVSEALEIGHFELVDCFARQGTEAMLVRHVDEGEKDGGILVLVFRGTQPTIKDIVTDVKANLVSAPGGGRVHSGFLEAYRLVEEDIKAACAKHEGLPLYITGHSLGGALAMLATRYLGSDSTGATYTFGCPRAADDEFYMCIKTPVYRVVNAADAVPRLPFGYGFSIFLSLIRLIPINYTREISEWLRRYFLGYTHYGNLTFLSAPENILCDRGIAFKDLVVKKSPNIFWRASLVVRRWVMSRGKSGVTDHRMAEYSQKLAAYALRRNS